MTGKVFVYGTLRRGGTNRPLIGTLIASSVPARIRGIMYALDEYPAVIPGSGSIAGELLSFTDPAEALRRLDALEDYHGPGDPRNEYERVTVRAELAGGGSELCCCYMYAKPELLAEKGMPVPEGDWCGRCP